MKVGSLVEALITFNYRPGTINPPIKGNIYTVRSIYESSDGRALRLEELINPIYSFCGGPDEVAFCVTGFREIQPPMTIDISELQHQTQTV